MVSLYVKGKENGHVQAYAPTGAMGLKRWGGLTSKLDGLPIASDPHLWWQACPWRKSLSRKIALTRIKFYGRKLQVKAFPAFGQMQGCADFMRLWRNFMPRQFSSMIFYYHLFIGEVRTIRNETTYPIHGKYPLNLNNTKKRMNQNFDTPSHHRCQACPWRKSLGHKIEQHKRSSAR